MELDLLLLIWSVMIAVLIPQLVAIVLLVVYRLIEAWVKVPMLILICAWAATCTTILLYLLDDKIHNVVSKFMKWRKETWLTRAKKWISSKINNLSHSVWFRFWIALWSSSIVPDLVLIELSRGRMKKIYFFLAIMTGKVLTYSILIGGAVWIFETLEHMLFT